MENNSNTEIRVTRLSDNVVARIAQIVQEGMIMGTDIVDLLRQIEIVDDGSAELQLNPSYMGRVLEQYAKLVEEAEVFKQNG
jgi:hypothetical protein